MSSSRKPATEITARRNREAAAALPFADEEDFAEAARGLIASFDPAAVTDAAGRTVWDLESYDFLAGEAPDTVHPSLWRQSQLNRVAGLFEIAPGFYQLRGFDLSNMHVVEGEQGIIVIDPLISAETAAAALALYREHRGDRPVTGADLHPQPHRPLRRRQGRPHRRGGGRARRSRCWPRPGSFTTRSARTSTPAPRWGAGPATCTAPCSSAARRPGRRRPRPDHLARAP